jgi:hypothetical protein
MMRDIDPAGWKHFAAKAWHDMGMVVIGPNQLNSSIDQTYVEQCAERLYGKRNPQNEQA